MSSGISALDKHKPVPVAAGGIVLEAVPAEFPETGGIFDAVTDYHSGHFATAHLGMDGDCLQTAVFFCQEFGPYDADFRSNALPVEEAFHLFARKVCEYAAVFLDFGNEHIGQERAPAAEHVHAVQSDTAFKTVRRNQVERPEKTVQE